MEQTLTITLILITVFSLWYIKVSNDNRLKRLENLEKIRAINDMLDEIKKHFNVHMIIDNAIKKLNNEKFMISVVGHWNHGKSTFINALLKDKILPHSTKILTKIEYAKTNILEISYHDQEADIQKFKNLNSLIENLFILENKFRLTFHKIKEITIKINNKFLKTNISIIDTPGYNNNGININNIIKITKNADLIIYLFDSRIYGNFKDFQIIKAINKHCNRNMLFILNYWDKKIDDDEKNGVLNDFREKLENHANIIDPIIYTTSSLYELQGQRLKKYKKSVLNERESKNISFYDFNGKHRFLETPKDCSYLINNEFEIIRNQINNLAIDYEVTDNKISYWKSNVTKLCSILRNKKIPDNIVVEIENNLSKLIL